MQYGNKNNITDDEKKEIEFKSYYVVWKHPPDEEKKEEISGLNRTMQYGNNQGLDAYCVTKRFKSYYVVWKPDECAFFGDDSFLFKSYYVVWKQ